MEFFTVRNWRKYQHYTGRNPPWIKLHYELLTSQDWVTLADASRVLAVACLLVASRHDGQVPNDPEYVQRVAYLHTRPDFKPLINCGLLELSTGLQADASKLQAVASVSDSDSVRRSIEDRSEENKSGRYWTGDDRVSDEWISWAMSKHGLSHDQARKEAVSFSDYWRSASGQRARKRDWKATWRNWIRRSIENRGTANGKQSAPERVREAGRQWLQRRQGKLLDPD